MVSIAPDLRAQILLVPIIEQQVVIVLLLAAPPGVERFIHDNYAHPVAEVE